MFFHLEGIIHTASLAREWPDGEKEGYPRHIQQILAYNWSFGLLEMSFIAGGEAS